MTAETPATTDAPMDLNRLGFRPGEIVGERYEIIRLLGEGGMGAVFEARHRVLGRVVAIKVLKPDLALNEQFAARFLQEARSAAELHHKNIVELTDYGVDRNRPFMVMEYLKGESFDGLLHREGPLTVARTLAIMDPVLRALAMAHDRGIIHRDIKPDNIFLVDEPDGPPIPKLVDFGIAKRPTEDNVQLTTANMALGTPAYMAPEQIMASRQVTGAADQYAVGVTLYESLTSRNPYDAETLNAFIVAKATQDPYPLGQLRPDLDPTLVAVVMRTLNRRPEDRFPSITALREALTPFRDVESGLRASPGVQASTAPAQAIGTAATQYSTASGPGALKGRASTTAGLEVPTSAPTPMPAVTEAPAKPPYGLIALACVVVVLVAGGGTLAVLRGHETHPTAAGPGNGTQSAPNALPNTSPNGSQVVFEVRAEPPATTIALDGVTVGTGHVELMRPHDGRRYQLTLSAPGYVPVSEVLAADGDVRIERQLQSVTAQSPTLPDGTQAGAHVHAGHHPNAPTVGTPTTAPATAPTTAPTAPTTAPEHPVAAPPEHPVHPPTDPHHPGIDRDNPFGT